MFTLSTSEINSTILKQLPTYISELIKYQQLLEMKNNVQLTSWQALKNGMASTGKVMLKSLLKPTNLVVAGVTAMIVVLHKTNEAVEEVRQKADELSNTFNNNKSDIEGYKDKIEDLYKMINDSGSSLEEVTTARQTLMTVQDELIDKFGDEKETIDLVTQAIYGQSSALDELIKKQWQETKNEFNESNMWNDFTNWQEGYSDNIDRMVNEMENAWGNIKMSISDYFGGEYDDIIKRLEEAGWEYSSTYETFVKGGSVEDLYEEILDIQTLVGDDMPDNFLKSLTDDANELKATLDNYEVMWDNYILNDRIFADKNLADSWKKINDAYSEYKDAFATGDEESIKKAQDNFASILTQATEGVSDESVVDFFNDMYPDLQEVVGNWQFEINFTANTDGLKDDVSGYLSGLDGLYSYDLKNFSYDTATEEQKASYDGLISVARLYGLTIDQLIDKLVLMGLVQDEEYQKLVDKFGKENIGKIAPEDLTFAYQIKNIDDMSFEELQAEIQRLKDELSKVNEPDISIPISKTISDLEDLNKELDNLGTAMANIDAEGKFDLGDLDSIADYFLGLEDVPYDIEAVNNALKSLGDGNASLEEQADSINTLADQYLKTSGILDILTQSNRNLIQVQLERMGIVNAEEIVTAALNEQTELQALNNQFLAATGYELVNASYAEIQSFLDECNASDEARQEISKLALAKLDLSSFHYDSSVDIQNIVNLANAAGAGAEQIATFQAAMNALNSSSRTKQDWGYQVLSQIKNGTYDWGYEKLDANKFKTTYTQVPKAIYNGGANVQKALDDANKAASKSAKETEDTYEELFDFFERRIEVLNDALDLLKSNLENVVGADAKNTLIDAQIGINKESINNYTDAIAMYTQKANEALAKIPAEFQSKIVDGSVSMTDFIGSGNEDLVKAINEYKDLAGKISDCKKELADLKQALEDLELEKFNNIVDDFTNQFDIRDNSKDLINKQIDLFKEAGQMIGQGFYQGLINESEGQLAILQQEKAKLVAQMNSALDSGNVTAGSEAWLSMVDSLSEVDSKILDCKKDIEEFNNLIQELHWEVVERIQKNFDGLSDEIKNIISLIDEVDVSDAEGIWSKEGLTQLGLYAQEYEKAIYAANMYGQEIEQLNQAYIRGEYSVTEYQDKLIELKNAQWDEINASESAKDAIMDLNKARIDIMVKAIEEEIDAMKELIDSKKEALDSEKDLYEYKKSISEKSKSVTDLEKQIAAMQNDTTQEGIARRKKLEAELVEAKQDLADYEYSHSIDVQKDALDQQYEDFETEKNAEIEKLEATLDDMEAVISASFEIVKEKALVIGTEINDIAQVHGVSISNEITSAWSKGADAIGYYGETLNAGASSFVSNLTTMKDSVYYLQNQADITSSSLANMYNTNSQALLNNLTNAYYSLANTNAVTQALGDSLINTLARGYDTSSLVNSIKNVGDSAASAAKQVSSLMNALAGQATNDTLIRGHSKGGNVNNDGGMSGVKYTAIKGAGYFATSSNSDSWIKVKKYAKGGIITKEDSGFLDPIARSVGEDHIIAAKDGESILTQVQTEEFMKLIPNMENFNKIIPNIIPDINTMVSPNAVKPNSPTVQIHYDNLVQVQGDVNNSNIRQMEQIVDNAITKQFNIFNTQLRKAGVR